MSEPPRLAVTDSPLAGAAVVLESAATGVPVAAAELAVVVDRMVVPRRRLEGEKLRLRHRARGDVKRLPEREVLEIAGGAEAMAGGIEGLGHCVRPRRERRDRPASGRGAR